MREDPALYDYRPWDERLPIRWPDGARVAFWVAPNIEFYELDPPANPIRKAWPRPTPDIQGYGTRDYGNRVGHMRMMELLDRHGVRGSVSLSVALCEHHPEIIDMCRERNWEFFSHGVYNTRYAYGMDEAQERADDRGLGAHHRRTYRASGAPATWPRPSRTPSARWTCSARPAGFIPATCFMTTSRRPCKRALRQAVRFRALLAGTQRHHRLCRQPHRAQALRRDDQAGLRPALPGRRTAVERSCACRCTPTRWRTRTGYARSRMRWPISPGTPDVWVTTGREIAEYFVEHYYDEAVAKWGGGNSGDGGNGA